MLRDLWIFIGCAVVGGSSSATTESSRDQDVARSTQPTDARRERPAGEGVICALGILSAMKEVGNRCFAAQDSEFQSELARSVMRLDEYVLSNSEQTAADLEAFKKDQSEVGAPLAELCRDDLTGMYKDMAARGPEPIKSGTNELVARPGQPTWGDCL